MNYMSCLLLRNYFLLQVVIVSRSLHILHVFLKQLLTLERKSEERYCLYLVYTHIIHLLIHFMSACLSSSRFYLVLLVLFDRLMKSYFLLVFFVWSYFSGF